MNRAARKKWKTSLDGYVTATLMLVSFVCTQRESMNAFDFWTEAYISTLLKQVCKWECGERKQFTSIQNGSVHERRNAHFTETEFDEYVTRRTFPVQGCSGKNTHTCLIAAKTIIHKRVCEKKFWSREAVTWGGIARRLSFRVLSQNRDRCNLMRL